MSLWYKSVILGLLTACAGLLTSLSSEVADAETDLGLGWLFALRGPRPAPADVVVVSIDRKSSNHFGLPNEPEHWPRQFHAHLVDSLRAAGARAVAFDIIFATPQDSEQDRRFAAAVEAAGNVTLVEYLKPETRPLSVPLNSAPVLMRIERRIPLLPELARAAAASAPFPLPKIPIRVNHFWTFKAGAGDAPTLPVMALHVYSHALLQRLPQLLPGHHPAVAGVVAALNRPDGMAATVRALHDLLRTRHELVSELRRRAGDPALGWSAQERALLIRLLELHSGPAVRYLDFYGPPRSIHTIPYHQALDNLELRDKAVFVGFSEQLQPEQKDGFHTVFSQPDGVDLSGVEIAATAFANLLEGRQVHPLPPPLRLLTLAAWGLIIGCLLRSLPAIHLPAAALLAGAAYLALAWWLFARDGLWLPLLVPLLAQLPLALFAGLLWHYLDAHRERRRMGLALGYYLPGQVVEAYARGSGPNLVRGQRLHGICLATDAEQYTALSESLEPDRLQTLLNSYYQVLFEPVRRHGGIISDVVGDAMLALWAAETPTRAPRRQACLAALEILTGLETDQAPNVDWCLPTRIGLHCGEIVLGNVGAGDHFEYRAVGDAVNTANRIQALNKPLGTRILLSADLIRDLDDVLTRELGSFRLTGKTQILVIHELLGRRADLDSRTENRLAGFAEALACFQERHWAQARARFQALLAEHGHDGPVLFYLWQCERFVREPPPAAWDGVMEPRWGLTHWHSGRQAV